MKVQILSDNQVRALISSKELIEHGIDIENVTYHDPALRSLFDDVINTLKENIDEKILKLPRRIEAIPVADGALVLIITWAAGEKEYLSEKGAVITPPLPPAPGDPHAAGQPPFALPIDELQSAVLADVLSAIATGDLVGHLKKYLNEDFLNELIAALSASGLEDIISSFLTDSDSEDVEQFLDEMLKEGSGLDDAEPAKAAKDVQAAVKPVYCLCITFKSLSDAENALAAAKLKKFAGDSTLIKTGKEYKLLLSPGRMLLDDFTAAVSSFQAIYNGEQHPTEYISYLAEHGKTIIKKDAVKTLLGI